MSDDEKMTIDERRKYTYAKWKKRYHQADPPRSESKSIR